MRKLNFLVLFFVTFFFALPSTYAVIAISPLKHELKIEQGEVITKKIKITNEGENTITLYTSTEDFISGDNSGQPTFLKPEDQTLPELSLANWVNIEEKNLTLIPGETREVNFTISVPGNGEPGGHYGAVFFSPGIQGNGKVAFSQRIGVLLLIEVPGEIVIDGNLESLKIGELDNKIFTNKKSFSNLPISFQSNFKNNGNIHLKPNGKIELIDEDGLTLKNIGKEVISTSNGTFIGEKLVDYLPINDFGGSVLPNSSRDFISKWEGFGYKILNENGTKTVEFKTLNEYYEDKASEKQAYLMFWEQIHSKNVKKKIIANYTLSYNSKNKEEKIFNKKEEFFITYNQKYIGLNYYLITILLLSISGILFYVVIQSPKNKIKKEEELRKKIIEEMKAKK